MPETILGAPVNVMKLAGRVALAEIVGGAVDGAVAPLLAEANRLQAFRDELDAELCEATKQLPHTVDEETWRISTCTERILLSVQWMKEIRDSSNAMAESNKILRGELGTADKGLRDIQRDIANLITFGNGTSGTVGGDLTILRSFIEEAKGWHEKLHATTAPKATAASEEQPTARELLDDVLDLRDELTTGFSESLDAINAIFEKCGTREQQRACGVTMKERVAHILAHIASPAPKAPAASEEPDEPFKNGGKWWRKDGEPRPLRSGDYFIASPPICDVMLAYEPSDHVRQVVVEVPSPSAPPAAGGDYRFAEPHATGGTCWVTVTKEQAIAWQRAAGKQRGYEYESDERALEDFLVVNWAETVPPAAEVGGEPKHDPQMLADALELVDVKAKIHDLCEWIHKQHNGTLRKFINGPYDITHLQLLAWAIAGLRTKPSPSAPPAAEVGGESDGMTLCDALAIARYKTCAIKHATWPEGCYAYHGVDNQLYICNPASTSRDLPLSMAVATLLDRQWMIDQWHPYHGHRHFAKAPSSPSQPPVTDKGTGEQSNG